MTKCGVSPTVDQEKSPPDQVIEELRKATLSHNDRQRAGRTRDRLEILHQICREEFEAGSLDFSTVTLGKKFRSQVGIKDRHAILRHPYRTLVHAWAALAGGVTKAPRDLMRERARLDTVGYIKSYFLLHGSLPSFGTIKQEGLTTKRQMTSDPCEWVKHIHVCLKVWQDAWLANVPQQVVLKCNQLFDSSEAIPTATSLHSALSTEPDSISEFELEAGIERWRQVRFALELWKFAPSSDKSNFRWLALHPELAKWRPLVLDYLTRVTDYAAVSLALHTFFAEYLFAQKLPLTPQAFLSKEFSPPSLQNSFKNLRAQDVRKRWRIIDTLLEHVLDRCDEFFTIDDHGHRTRRPIYHNGLPPYVGKTDQSPKKKFNQTRLPGGALNDPELRFLTDLNPQLEQWRIYAVSWLATLKANLGSAQNAIKQLIVVYIIGQRLPSNPSVLLSLKWQRSNVLPPYSETALKTTGSKHAIPQFAKAADFVDYVLQTHYSAEDDYGRRTVSGDFNNFLRDQGHNISRGRGQGKHSNKDVLPTRYIRYLRELLCPIGSHNFRDLAWAHGAVPSGDWFVVHPDVIDKSDPDCVWRERIAFPEEANSYRKGKTVCEMWSPVRTVALMLKLELPLRTFQVILTDSGEADTWCYEGTTLQKNHRGEWTYNAGQFIKNTGALVSDVGKTERHAGFFRRMPDPLSGKVFAGLYINTNKTQDRGKEQWDRGYVVPWQHGKVLYWCEKLRNWQKKYNPIDQLVPCTVLPDKVLGKKLEIQKQQMGSMCFLFRDAIATTRESAWPITDAKLTVLWERMLEKLGEICAEKGHSAVNGTRLRFIRNSEHGSVSGLYSLHSLRVSLITHLATEGGVEMHILSECIAGHARILMTLYYKKSGVVYVSEAMDAASERLREEAIEQKNWIRWMSEASLKQLEVNCAAVDASVLHLVNDALSHSGAQLLRTNLGLCAKGGMGCDTGGVSVEEDTGSVSYGPVPGYPQQKNCVRCRWFLTGPAFLQALVHHWNLLHFNLGDTGHSYLQMSKEVAELESAALECQRVHRPFNEGSRLEDLRHALAVVYDGNEKLALDSLATMKLIVRCKHIIDAAKNHESGVVLVAVGGIDELTINVRECNELEQVLTTALGSTVFVDEDAHKAVLKAGNAFDRMLAMNGKEPIFFKLSDKELPTVVGHMTRLLQAYAGSIGRAVPFIEGAERLSGLGLFGDTEALLRLASAGTPLHLTGSDEEGPILGPERGRVIPLVLTNDTAIVGR
jgi:hypothetical protein